MTDRPAPAALLDSAPEEGARRLALRWIADATSAGERLMAATDAEALHDLRVALRKLRTVLRVHEDELHGSLRRKRARRLKALVASTGEGRDTEVQLAWLETVRPELEGGAVRGLEWLAERLRKRREAAYAKLREKTVPALLVLLPKLRRDLERYEVEHVVHEVRSSDRFAWASAALLRAQADELGALLRRIETSADEERAHEARKEGKRLRYLLEPLRDEGFEGARELVKSLKGLQDVLGELNDVAVRARLLRDEIERAALERARRLAAQAEGLASEGVTATSEGDEQLGLLALVRITHDRRAALFARVLGEWVAEGSSLDALLDGVEALAARLEAYGRRSGPDGAPPREIERKYLLSAMPEHARAFPAKELDQGYIPGEKLHERLRRTRKDGEERWFRTVKLGSGLSRIEVDEETTREIFAKMWPLTKGRRVRKRRFVVPEGDLVWEIDLFLDRDLVLAEVELPTEDTLVPLPAWLAPLVVREVTDESAYVNLNLAR
jgi:CHAD domain-containing protein/CYTH domain-containing protein